MELNKLIGMLCMAAMKAGVELTAWEAYRLGFALAPELALDAKTEIPPEIQEKEKAREPKINVYEESIPMPDVQIVPLATRANKTSEQVSEQPTAQVAPQHDETPAPAALGDESKPKVAKEKPSNKALSPREQQMWDYVQECPDASMNDICAEMGIKAANFYLIRKQLKNKGYVIPENKPVAKKPAPADQQTKAKASEKYGRNILKNIGKIHQEENRDMNQRMEDAYLGEHPNIQPDPVQKKPVSEKAQRLYEYMKSHPDSRMPKTCEDLNITNADYYMLKAQLKKNGWIESAVENVQAY